MFIDLTGQRYGKFVVLSRCENNKYGRAVWLCKCDCGNIKQVAAADLRKGNTKSCGCLKVARAVETNTTHEKSTTRLYKVWAGIKRRCYNTHEQNYFKYGGRGIIVCEEWQSFEPFYEWAMSHGYRDDLTIDRIDVNGNYEPSNCRWATAKEQANNRRNSHLITYNGETHTMTEWGEIVGINAGAIWKRIKRGWSVEAALTTPAKR
jgi:hypothetical protein